MIDPKLLLDEKRKYGLPQIISKKEFKLLKKNTPIQKIIGYIEMANVKIDLSQKVLIPRYETEELIFHSIDLIKKNKYYNILDLCCGTGFIGIAIKKNVPKTNVFLLDIDRKAIKQSKINAKLNNVNVNIIKSNMFKNIPKNIKFDLIISNPPYLLNFEKKTMSSTVLKHEPKRALFAKKKGLFFYSIIDNKLKSVLNKDGSVVLEINPISYKWFKDKNYELIKDINNKIRFAKKQI